MEAVPMRSLSAFGVCALLLACDDPRTYVGEGTIYQVALTSTTMPAIQGEEGALFIVETHAELPIRAPSDAELTQLRDGVKQYKMLPFSRLPWVGRDDLALQVDFTLSNLDKDPHEADVIINGVDEFFEYEPGVQVVEDDPLPLHSQWERNYEIPGDSRISGTVREEELDEVAVDLATVVNGAPDSDEVVYFENKSETDPRSMKYIPAVVPGLTGLRLGVRATEAMTVLLEATVRVRDVGNKLAGKGDKVMKLSPMLFQSVVPAN
jgi:hypothetical protein